MGHERVGVLPKTKRWARILEEIEAFSSHELEVAELAESTLRNVEDRYRRIHLDGGVQAAFSFLVALPLAVIGSEDAQNILGIDITENPGVFALASALKRWVKTRRASLEYSGIAERAASDAIGYWVSQHGQPGLFGDRPAREVWGEASTGRGFCELARCFFAKFTERYLKYFLDRGASSRANTIESRNRLDRALKLHVHDVSRHAFETSEITQSFAAGWFNKHVSQGMPSQRDIEAFLVVAFGKLREEILREAGDT